MLPITPGAKFSMSTSALGISSLTSARPPGFRMFTQMLCLPRLVAMRREFDLDNLGAHPGHHPRRRRSGNEVREIQDPVTIEQMLWLSLSHSFPPGTVRGPLQANQAGAPHSFAKQVRLTCR